VLRSSWQTLVACLAQRAQILKSMYGIGVNDALATWFGTASMFDAHGFEKVAKFGKSIVLMRKQVRQSSKV
jgi:hypothetical protein